MVHSGSVYKETATALDPVVSEQQVASIHLAIKYIENNLDRPLTLAEIASQVFLSRAYLSTRFKQATGENIGNFIYTKRMQLAKRLLLSTQKSIQDIAVKCGYASPSYFSASFRRYYRKTPRAFRQEAEQEIH